MAHEKDIDLDEDLFDFEVVGGTAGQAEKEDCDLDEIFAAFNEDGAAARASEAAAPAAAEGQRSVRVDVPGWPAPQVEGHGGSLVVGDLGGARVACLTGRVHLYEGWQPAEVVRAVRTLRHWGAGTFLLTNAAGGVNADFAAGDLMVVTDHLNLTGCSPLVGRAEPALGPRFSDQSAVYSPGLREVLLGADDDLRLGVYAGLPGPSYETPAEVRMLRTLGADAVGMSTVQECLLNRAGAQSGTFTAVNCCPRHWWTSA